MNIEYGNELEKEEDEIVKEEDEDPAHEVTRSNVLASLNHGIAYERFNISSLI